MRVLPGQYVMVSFEDRSQDRRAYSVVRYDAMSKTITLLVKIAGAFTKKLSLMNMGDEIFVYGPFGKFILHGKKKLMFISGGIGVVPLYSMLLNLIYTKNFDEIYFYYSSQKAEDMTLKHELESLNIDNIHVKLYFTKELDCERFSVDDIKSVHEFMDYDYYICGPDKMMNEIISGLMALGISKENIHKESYIMKSLQRK